MIVSSLLTLLFLSSHSENHTSINPLIRPQIQITLKTPIENIEIASYSLIEYGEEGSLVNAHSNQVSSFLSTIRKILEFGEAAEGLNYSSYKVNQLLENREVLEAILEHPEYLESVVREYVAEGNSNSEIRLTEIIRLTNEQYILYFLESTGLHSQSGIHFLFTFEGGISSNPLLLSEIRRSDFDHLELMTKSAISNGFPHYEEGENEYYYFWSGSSRNLYSNFKYSVQDGQLVLNQQLIGVQKPKDGYEYPFYEITRFVYQDDEWIELPLLECSSSIDLWEVEDLNQIPQNCIPSN